jgi:thioredoxin-related protein
MRLTLATFFAAAGFLLCPALASAQIPDIKFRQDYNETRKEADKKGLPLILYFTTDNCPWCVKLQRDTFADPVIAKVMNDKFVPLKIYASQEPKLCELLNVRAFPTVILAGPDGKILMTVEGYQDAARFHDSLQRVLVAVSNPDWMVRDYQVAVKAINDKDYPRGVALLKTIVEDGKGRPVQINAAALLQQLEQQAASELAQAKQMLDKGKANEASAVLTKLVKDYAGTQAAPEAAGMLTSLAKTTELKGVQRLSRARELLAQAKDDYRTEQWLCCLDRCDLLINSYADLPEAREAAQMASTIRSNTEWMQKSCDSMTSRLADMYLSLAETWLQKGQPQQAMLCLERVILTFPGTRQAEAARARMLQLQGVPSQQTGLQNKS